MKAPSNNTEDHDPSSASGQQDSRGQNAVPTGSRSSNSDQFRLRGDPPRVTRLSRKFLLGLGGTAAIAIAAALGYGLHTTRQDGDDNNSANLYDAQNHNVANGLSSLPSSYAGLKTNNVPQLGKPLPGDLGTVMVNPHTNAASGETNNMDSASQRQAQIQQAALTSKLFIQADRQPNNQNNSGANSIPGTDMSSSSATTTAAPTDTKTAFMDQPTNRNTVSPERLQQPVSPYVVQAGTIIPAALITGIRSDLPGQIIAQVTQNVYDSPTGHYLLIPQGAKLIGEYQNSISFGQNRVLLVWTRLIMPDGNSIVLDRLPGTDTQGYAGLYDQVNNHWGSLLAGAVLSTILSVAAEAGTSDSENNLAQALRMGASNSVSQTGQQIVQRELDVQPTLTIRPGFPVDVMVTRDLALQPYNQGSPQ